MDMMSTTRGLFVLVEGGDKCGKTTLVTRIVNTLKANGHDAVQWHFPQRDTAIGQILHRHLCGESILDPHVSHLLFSANRWEFDARLRQQLTSGTTVVMDRYALSGVAYSVGAHGLDVEWCKAPDRGLVAPDLTFYLDTPHAAQRGEEIYEHNDIQTRVLNALDAMRDVWPASDSAQLDCLLSSSSSSSNVTTSLPLRTITW